MSTVLQQAKSLIGKSEAEVREQLGGSIEEDHKSGYEKLSKLLELNSPAFPGSIYVLKDKVRIVYVPEEGLSGVTPDELSASLSGEPHQLRSRAGKLAKLHLYASDGVAFSSTKGTVDFLEVFPPCTVKEYVDQIYDEPPAFKR
jgi:hypothetical protein